MTYRDSPFRQLKRIARRGYFLVMLATLACVSEEPSTSPLDLRTHSDDEARVSGQVRASAGDARLLPVPKAVVELGRWRGGPHDLSGLLGEGVAATPDDPRFRVIARALVDDSGAYHFREVPRGQIFGLRARPPAGTPYQVTYLDSLFSLGQGRDRWKCFRIVLEPISKER
jgi:hypothetical protein